MALLGDREAYRVLVSISEGKRPHGTPRYRWEYDIKMGLQVGGWGGKGWIVLASDRDRLRTLVNAVMSLRVP